MNGWDGTFRMLDEFEFDYDEWGMAFLEEQGRRIYEDEPVELEELL